MTGILWLDSAVIAVSIFNTILLLWLGLTVLLNARTRSWGVWLVGGGFLAGAIFFVSHTAILGQEAATNLDGLNFWWRVGWLPVMLSPFAWYVAVLWFCGCWSTPQSTLWRRHRGWLWGMILWLALLLVMQVAANVIPAYDQFVQSALSDSPTLQGASRLLLLFPLWMIACVLLSLDVLRQAASLVDATAETAFRRAQPWLVGAALALLVVTLAVTWVVATVVLDAGAGDWAQLSTEQVALYDLAISMVVATATLLLGQAITAYEIFMGRTLPRRSLARHWRSVILLAAGFSMITGWSIAVHLRPIYALLLATLLLTTFYALYSWRSFRDRERLVAQLRPAVQTKIAPRATHNLNVSTNALLADLCTRVLGTGNASILPTGRVAQLGVLPLVYPPDQESLHEFPGDAPNAIAPLDGEHFAPYAWSIPLWDARERMGVLLIGARDDGRLFNEEMLESAQAYGERILHQMIGEQMVTRLREVQQKRIVEQRLIDQRTRRTLHDEILPALHLAILQLHGAENGEAVQETKRTLTETHARIADLLAVTQPPLARAVDPCEMVSSLCDMVAEFAGSFDAIIYDDGLRSTLTTPFYVDPVTGEVLLGAAREAMRNAANHGRGGDSNRLLTLRLSLCVMVGEPDKIRLTISDDGVGVAAGAHNETSAGAGTGLALHGTLLAMIGGALMVDSPQVGGTRVTISAPQ